MVKNSLKMLLAALALTSATASYAQTTSYDASGCERFNASTDSQNFSHGSTWANYDTTKKLQILCPIPNPNTVAKTMSVVVSVYDLSTTGGVNCQVVSSYWNTSRSPAGWSQFSSAWFGTNPVATTPSTTTSWVEFNSGNLTSWQNSLQTQTNSLACQLEKASSSTAPTTFGAYKVTYQ